MSNYVCSDHLIRLVDHSNIMNTNPGTQDFSPQENVNSYLYACADITGRTWEETDIL